MEKVEVKVLSPGVEFDVYVNGLLVRSLATLQALKRYLRWLLVVNCDNIVSFDFSVFGPGLKKITM